MRISKLFPVVFFISVESPHLSCSPDVHVSCTCHGLGIVEVKCHYSAINTTVNDVADSNSDFCLKCLKFGNLHLKTTHSYYYQCQYQLYVTKYRYCDLVVWSTQSIHIERVHFEGKLLENVLSTAKHFLQHCILPEILSKWY